MSQKLFTKIIRSNHHSEVFENINPKHEILNSKQYGNSNLECSKHLLDFGHLEFEFVSSFGLPAMPLTKSTAMPENIIVPPAPSRNTSSNAWQAGIRSSDFGFVFAIDRGKEITSPGFFFVPLELLEEPDVVLKKQPNVIEAGFQHGHALDSHAECETGVNLRIVTDKTIKLGIIHA